MATKYNEEVFEAINEVSTNNAKWLDGELEQSMRSSAAGDNDNRVTENTARVTELREAAEKNRDVIRGIYERAAENRALLEKDLEDVNDLRNEIVGLREKIAANQHRVADKISDL
jgi:Mg2+ and Co2+ transporter CorA